MYAILLLWYNFNFFPLSSLWGRIKWTKIIGNVFKIITCPNFCERLKNATLILMENGSYKSCNFVCHVLSSDIPPDGQNMLEDHLWQAYCVADWTCIGDRSSTNVDAVEWRIITARLQHKPQEWRNGAFTCIHMYIRVGWF